MDRPLPKAEDNQAITRDDLVQSLLDLKPIQNNKLHLPLRPQLLEKLEEMLQVELQKAIDVAQNFVNLANEGQKPHGLVKDFQSAVKTLKYPHYIKFFHEHRLLSDAEERLDSFQMMVDKTIEFIQFQRKQETTQISRKVLHIKSNMLSLR